ncbi:hypothetical protein MPER_15402, partial [Moniliophthora perniciosa FA553]
PDTALLRECAIRHALQAGDKDVAQELKSQFNRYMETGDLAVIPSDLKELAFIAAVRFGGSAEYEAVRKIVKDAPSPATRSVAMQVIF